MKGEATRRGRLGELQTLVTVVLTDDPGATRLVTHRRSHMLETPSTQRLGYTVTSNKKIKDNLNNRLVRSCDSLLNFLYYESTNPQNCVCKSVCHPTG